MISNATIVSMMFSVLFTFMLFGGFILFYRKKLGMSLRPLILGSVGFIAFTQILEKVLHVIVISNFPNYADHPWLFGLYGGLAAGIFEEIGRLIIFMWLLKEYRKYKDGVFFGIGWGGIEAILIMLTMVVPNIIFAFLINGGTFESNLADQLPSDQIASVKETIMNQGTSYYLLACAERVFAVFMQVAFSLLVLTAVVKKKYIYVAYAVLIHAAIDFPLAFYQTGHIKNIWIIEGYLAIIGAIAFVMIKKIRRNFD